MTKIGAKVGIPGGMADFMLFDCEELLDGKVENEIINSLHRRLSDLYEVEIGLIVGDEQERAECQAMKDAEASKEIAIIPPQDSQFVGL